MAFCHPTARGRLGAMNTEAWMRSGCSAARIRPQVAPMELEAIAAVATPS
jgi:hypothetical protein